MYVFHLTMDVYTTDVIVFSTVYRHTSGNDNLRTMKSNSRSRLLLKKKKYVQYFSFILKTFE